MTNKPLDTYQNNPFMIGIEGLKLIFTNAKTTGIYAICVLATAFVIGVLAYIAGLILEASASGQASMGSTGYSDFTGMGDLLVVVSVIVVSFLVYMAISLLLFGPLEYAAAITAQGKQASLQEGFKVTLKNFPAYFWMYLIFTVKVLLWSLLFIVPGFIMFNRYILSGTVFFAEGKRGNAAIKRSAELTKGAWLTTYGGAWVWGIISQGMTTWVFWPGQMAILYRQLKAQTDAKQPKPPAHLLSWLALLVPYVLALIYLLFVGVIFALMLMSGTTAP